jgi:hypothetical protein
MARLNSGTRIYGNATIDTFATIGGNLNIVGGNVNIANGGTVTAITGTAAGSYTTVPTITISAPTTAGGVQATGTCAMNAVTISVASGGSGYAIADTITLTGGTFSTSIILTVASLSGSAVATFTAVQTGTYTVLPTNPISQGSSSGAGTGATFNITAWGVRTTAYTITNAGSGYVSQPTITFSGGGGSGAAAYATVGAIPKVQALGNSISYFTPTGEQMRVADRSGVTATSTRYVQVSGGVNGVTAPAVGTGGGSEAFDIYSSGGFGIYLATNGIRTATQAVISHTPSAVNYVNLTGSTGNNGVTISAQGTGTNLDVIVTPKGTGNLASTGNITSSGFVKTTAVVVASLPNAATAGAGARSFVTDATAATFGTVAAGGAANAVPVWSDGTNWKIG